MIIDLSKPQEMPAELLEKLDSVSPRVWASELSDEVVKHRDVWPIVQEIDEFCRACRVLGIHYTRADPTEIRDHGLLLRTGDEIRQNFLNQHGHQFSSVEIDRIKAGWEEYFTSQQVAARDGRIWFNFTREALFGSGAKPLLEMYGGEQISMCFRRDCVIGNKLSLIGEPLVVSCALSASDVNTYIQYAWGQILVSSYHKQKNPGAYRIDQDGSQRVPVLPENIISIEVLKIRP